MKTRKPGRTTAEALCDSRYVKAEQIIDPQTSARPNLVVFFRYSCCFSLKQFILKQFVTPNRMYRRFQASFKYRGFQRDL